MKLLSLIALLGIASSLQGAEDPIVTDLRAKAEQGNASAQWRLGVRYYSGQGVVKDGHEAARWYRKAAEQGHAAAQFGLGGCYATGKGVLKDEVEAVKWWRKAAEQGHTGAQCNLGVCYAKGEGVAKDEVEAYKWYLIAGAKGDKDAKRGIKRLERELGAKDRMEGQKRAKEWQAEFSKGQKPK